MYKILFTLLFLLVFLIPKVEIFAKPNPFPLCSTESIKDNTEVGRANPNLCPDSAICYIPVIGISKEQLYKCYEKGDRPASEIISALNGSGGYKAAPAAVDPCIADHTKCTGGKGLQCKEGKIVETDGDGIMTAIGCVPTQPQKLVEGLLKYGTFAAGGIAFLIMILGAIQMITAEGNPESIKHAQERFYSAIIGLLLIIFAVLLMQVIGVDILGLPGFGPQK